ncbi:MAG: branched-chain amino acid ABC transporter permease [bacterium]|nr:MAG: branched-chain amino acid ABC transporter permease [bacterium]
MNIFFQQLVNGLTIGGIYALIALGYTMVYGVMKLINFAHGDLVALAAYIGLTIFMKVGTSSSGLSILLIVLIGTIMVIVFAGMMLEMIAYRPLRNANAPRLSAVVSALGASMVFENGMMLLWGPNLKIFPSNILPSTSWSIGSVIVSSAQLFIIVSSFVFMLLLHLFINKTKLGTAIRAAAIDQEAAQLMGINVNRVIVTIFVLGSGLAAIGGIFVGIYYREVYFNMGWLYGLNAFVAAIVGGIGNIPGAMLGGILLGVFNAFIAGYVSSSWSEAFTFILLIGILIFRPTGILGERVAEKV